MGEKQETSSGSSTIVAAAINMIIRTGEMEVGVLGLAGVLREGSRPSSVSPLLAPVLRHNYFSPAIARTTTSRRLNLHSVAPGTSGGGSRDWCVESVHAVVGQDRHSIPSHCHGS